MASDTYVIQGGSAGRERLRLLSRVMGPTSLAVLDRVGIAPGARCLDVGCGGGDVTLELARRAAPHGRVLGIDLDETKLELARQEARELGVENVEFRRADATDALDEAAFDLVYCRFILSHLADPAGCVANLHAALRPGGALVVEDIDFAGHFCHPPCDAFRRYVELYAAAVRRRGGDPHLGPRLPALLMEAGFEEVDINVVQPAGCRGDVKRIAPVTMECIGEALLADGLVSPGELERILAQLYAFAEDTRTMSAVARVVQAWGRRAG